MKKRKKKCIPVHNYWKKVITKFISGSDLFFFLFYVFQIISFLSFDEMFRTNVTLKDHEDQKDPKLIKYILLYEIIFMGFLQESLSWITKRSDDNVIYLTCASNYAYGFHRNNFDRVCSFMLFEAEPNRIRSWNLHECVLNESILFVAVLWWRNMNWLRY